MSTVTRMTKIVTQTRKQKQFLKFSVLKNFFFSRPTWFKLLQLYYRKIYSTCFLPWLPASTPGVSENDEAFILSIVMRLWLSVRTLHLELTASYGFPRGLKAGRLSTSTCAFLYLGQQQRFHQRHSNFNFMKLMPKKKKKNLQKPAPFFFPFSFLTQFV